MTERDTMVCRSCGNEERASEGYPCDGCGTFVCQICELRGVRLCASCQALADAKGGSADPTASDA